MNAQARNIVDRWLLKKSFQKERMTYWLGAVNFKVGLHAQPSPNEREADRCRFGKPVVAGEQGDREGRTWRRMLKEAADVTHAAEELAIKKRGRQETDSWASPWANVVKPVASTSHVRA
jgi:hypothetical protein